MNDLMNNSKWKVGSPGSRVLFSVSSTLNSSACAWIVCCFGVQMKMAAAESESDAWQSKGKTFAERNKYMFNNPLISDVKFIVRDSTQSTQTVALPAHKYVLAISSPVFFAMFYGGVAETGDDIQLPDCDSESLKEFLRFLYCDEVHLDGNGVLQILYLAKKYIIPSLSRKCYEFLDEHVGAHNVFTVLSGAQKFEEEDLINKCWEVVDWHTQEVLHSEDFEDVSKDTVVSMLSRDSLRVREVELFKAVDLWAGKECVKQGKKSSAEEKRVILGESTINLIRFPLMSEKEFAELVPRSHLLSDNDVCTMFLYFNSVSRTPVKYSTVPRGAARIELMRCKRFHRTISPVRAVSGWAYGGNSDELGFSVESVYGGVTLYGVRLFGKKKSRYQVKLVLHETSGSLVQQIIACTERTFNTEPQMRDGYYGYDVLLDQPYHIDNNKSYAFCAQIVGPPSYYGVDGKSQVRMCRGSIKFTFSNVGGANCSDSTNINMGQFVEVIFSPHTSLSKHGLHT